jgi:carbon-monoxide dehydrogenase small subunit
MSFDKYSVAFTVNGHDVTLEVSARTSLAEALRDELGLTGTHIGCEHGVCGACTILLDGEPVRSCLLFAAQLEGASVISIEGLARDGQQHPVQSAFRECHALQCGFCTPGMVLTVAAFLDGNRSVTEQSVREAISGNLCMCTGYQNIVRAALRAAKTMDGKKA